MALFLWLSLVTLSHLVSAQSNNYLIHMDSMFMPKAFIDHHSWYLSTLSTISLNSKLDTKPSLAISSNKLIYTYSHVMNGFCANLSPTELEVLKTLPGYISSIKDSTVKLHTTHSSQFLDLNSNYGLWPTSNYGKDIIIGLVDTGVWPESESFSDDGMSQVPSRWKGECESGPKFNSSLCNKKLIGARFFNKGLIASNPNLTIAMNSPRDTDGHGTHTSTTAAGSYVQGASYFGYASGTARGIAPKARVAMYKALWDEGIKTSDIIAAIDKAIVDGVDVLSLSFGFNFVPFYQDPVAIATFAALKKGVFVSTSAGNDGPFYRSLHNGTPWVVTVAAATMDRDFSGILTLGNGNLVTGTSLYPGNSNSPSTQKPIIFFNTCDNLKLLQKVGKIFVVCLDTNGTLLNNQVQNIQKSNVSGGVFITNSTDLDLFIQSSFPAIFLNPNEGEIVIDYINSNVHTKTKPKASMTFGVTRLGIKPAPSVASYSSRGPSPTSPTVLKPDIMGPGTLVLASWPKNVSVTVVNGTSLYGNFNLLTGTSMSCPHVAGIAALLKGAHPEWSPAAIRSAIMTTADNTDNALGPIKDIAFNYQPASPLAMGAGHVNPNKALNPGLVYDTEIDDYINFLCALNYSTQQIQVITGSNSYNCSNPSLDINYPSFIAFFNVNIKNKSEPKIVVRKFQRTLTNVGEGQSTYVASVTRFNAGLRVRVVPNKLVFENKNQKLSFKLIIEGPKQLGKAEVFGFLSWTDYEHKRVVRSPILATSLDSEPVHGPN